MSTISAIDLFSIGVGPSSSHTVGPMRAANAFAQRYPGLTDANTNAEVRITLHGSLAATGVGHGTDRASILGLVGYTPTTVEATTSPAFGSAIPEAGVVSGPAGSIRYRLTFDSVALPEHPNAMTIVAYDAEGDRITPPARFYSVGGGFILDDEAMQQKLHTQGTLGSGVSTNAHAVEVPYPFTTGDELMRLCQEQEFSIPEIMRANERALHGDLQVLNDHLDAVWATMRECVTAGIATPGILPGGLDVCRRAPGLYQHLQSIADDHSDALWAMEWVNLYALAVNEENAAGGRIVTAPTNGAAGIIPAVLHYVRDFLPNFTSTSHRDFLLAAAAVGIIIKENASISGAEVGCQGEVGSASAMAAAGLCQLMGGTPSQVEHAAEIALEHNLGLTCDPVGGLVQIPCIERNAIGAVKSINAARLSCLTSGDHRVRLDDAVQTMAATGRDMLTKYKETSTGGLAVHLGLPVNLTEC